MIGAIIHSLEDAIADRLPAHTRFGLVEQWNTDQGLRPIQYQGGGQGAVVLQDASLDLSYWRLRGPVEQRTGDNCDEVNLLYPLRLVFLVDRTSDVCADVSGALGEIMLGIRLMERAVQTAIPGASASIVSMRAEGDTSRAVATEIPGIELPPQRALAFIDIALSITGDTDCLSNCGPYTGSEVVPSDACYYLRVCGTPTEGQVPTSESGRTVWATPGTGPAGSGDVVGPASAVNNNFAAFNLTTGKLIKDSGVSAASFDAAGAASAAQAASQPLDADLTAYANAANPAARRALIGAGTGSGDVVGPASATADSLARFDGTTDKLLKDGLATSTGANQTADAGKVLIFGPSGGVTAFADGTVSPSGVSASVIGGPNTNAAIGAQAFDAFAARVVNESTTRPALEAQNDDTTNVGPLAHFHRDDGLGMEVANDGGLAWTSASGAATTRTNLGLGTLATQSGTFSGTSSGTNTGDQTTIVGITGTLAEFNTSLTGADFATGGGTATGTNTGDQTTVSGNAGTATALQTARTINGVSFDGSANIVIMQPNTPFMQRSAVAFAYNNLPAAADFFQGLASASVFPADLTHATQARIYVYTATTGSAGSKLSIRYKTGAWSSTPGDYSDIGTSEVAATVGAANTFTDSGWVNLTAGAKAEIHVSVFGLGGNGSADPTFNILGVQFR